MRRESNLILERNVTMVHIQETYADQTLIRLEALARYHKT